MKHKFNFWLQIVTICLCICAIAVGVYSATTASITASGKIAFTAHNCKVEVTGYIYGHATGDVHDGLPVAKENKEYLTTNNAPITIEGGVSTTTQSTISIGENRWFSDMASTDGKPADIVIGITVKNITIYDITVTANLDEVTYPQSQVTVSCDTESANLKQNESVTFEFTLSFNTNANSAYTAFDLTNLVIPIYAEKYVYSPYFVIDDGIDQFQGMLATTMGHGTAKENATNVKLDWIAFAVRGKGANFATRPDFVPSSAYSITVDNDNNGTDDATWYSLMGIQMQKSYAKGNTFWFAQRYLTAGGYWDADGNFIDGVQFNTYITSHDCVNYCNKNSNLKSSIYNYVVGDYLTDIGIKDANGNIVEDLFNNIKTRSVKETYHVSSDNCSATINVDFEAKLWIMNGSEAGLFEGSALAGGGDYGISAKPLAYPIGNISGGFVGTYVDYWLRTPLASDEDAVIHRVGDVCVGDEGGKMLWSSLLEVNSSRASIRSAFEITIDEE